MDRPAGTPGPAAAPAGSAEEEINDKQGRIAARRVGRFVVRRLLGRGAQSSVYLAFDPHLEREVAIKTLAAAPGDRARSQALMGEARTVSKLRHRNVVPIFEAGEHGGEAYLVFEYVDGRTLEQMLREAGALPPVRAAELMIGVLDALGEAHSQGIVHRDLKPSNVLVDAQGLARVMDFGIAAPVASAGDRARLRGTPAYMAPEYIAGQPVSVQCDVFAAGLVLYEMVFGRRAVQADSTFQALHRIANEDLQWPQDGPAQVDGKLRDIIGKAAARNPQMRYASAADMRKALADYLQPLLDAGTAGDKSGGGTLEFLLRRMRLRSDFPAMSSAISAITRLASSDNGDVNTLSSSILKDFALTNKILRVSNSVYYRQFGGGISTVSRAIVVLGFTTLRNIALSLMFFEHLQNKQHAELLREEFLRVNLSGMLARQLAQPALGLEPEESFICAQFHNLGRLLAHYYFPEEAAAIARLAEKEGCGEEAAAVRVLGIGLQELGIGIARSWGFPESIVQSMQRLPPGKVQPPRSREERLRTLSGYANEYCAAVEAQPQERAPEFARLQARFGDSVPVTERQLAAALEKSVEDVAELARIVHVDFGQTRIGRKFLPQDAAAGAAPAAARSSDISDVLAGTAAVSPPEPLPPGAGDSGRGAKAGEPARPSDAAAALSAGIQDLSSALVEERPLGTLLGIAVETVYRALGFQRVLLCMRDGRTGTMSARFGFGRDADEIVPRFRFALADSQDIFNLVLAKDVDVLISDAGAAKIAPHIPEWHRRDIGAPTFIVFPLRMRNVPVAMIYADKDSPGSIVVSPRELGLLRTLRNQVLLAIKQAA
ncbi:MAG: HDOD domain-containing protein [Nevskia sp.]|nr:HDOD domain-containing protein [Nevskia sp.]